MAEGVWTGWPWPSQRSELTARSVSATSALMARTGRRVNVGASGSLVMAFVPTHSMRPTNLARAPAPGVAPVGGYGVASK